MKPGDTVRLSQEGKNVRHMKMSWWFGEVLKITDEWITVLWTDRMGDSHQFTERPEDIEIVESNTKEAA